MRGNYPHPDFESSRPNKEIPYTTERKRMWKGKMSPIGTVFLVVRIKHGKGKYTHSLLIKGGGSAEEEKEVAKKMAESLIKKYNLK